MKLYFIRKHFGAYEWKRFTRDVRPHGGLLSTLPNYPDSLLVTGCQRSGTTLVTRLLVQSPEINDIWETNDDEYDAAMILSGNRQIKSQGRYCFQTTYLNNAYKEYIDNKGLPFKIIWVVRNPFSVVNSMLYNWKQFALNDTYNACGKKYFHDYSKNAGGLKSRLFGPNAVEKACFTYIGKQKQLFELARYFSDDRLFVINYESLIENPEESVPELFNFAEIDYSSDYLKLINTGSDNGKAVKNTNIIEEICMDTYKQAMKIAKI